MPLPGDWNDVLRRSGTGRGGRHRRERPHALDGRRRLVVVLAFVVTASALAVSAFLVGRGFIGLPPQGASPSTPPVGKLVLEADGRCTAGGNYCGVWMYTDGRLIWIRDARVAGFGANKRTTGLLEQRLTSTGIKLLRSIFIATYECKTPRSRQQPVDCTAVYPGPAPFPRIAHPGWEDVTWGLPPSAWRNSVIRAYVPQKFGFCFVGSYRDDRGFWPWRELSLSRLLTILPRAAGTILSGRRALPDPGRWAASTTCLALTTDEARRLARALNDAGVKRLKQPTYVLSYRIDSVGHGGRTEMWFAPLLPNGEWVMTGGG
jgi:hypothetical protein